MPPETVTVPETAPVQATPRRALRLFVGRFIVDFVETFGAMVVGIQLFIPTGVEDWKKQALLLATPAISALISAGRRAWPSIKDWLLGLGTVVLGTLR